MESFLHALCDRYDLQIDLFYWDSCQIKKSNPADKLEGDGPGGSEYGPFWSQVNTNAACQEPANRPANDQHKNPNDGLRQDLTKD